MKQDQAWGLCLLAITARLDARARSRAWIALSTVTSRNSSTRVGRAGRNSYLVLLLCSTEKSEIGWTGWTGSEQQKRQQGKPRGRVGEEKKTRLEKRGGELKERSA
eukprot:2476907-Rhodomonas_salina.1